MKKILLIIAVSIFMHSLQAQNFKGGIIGGIVGSQVDGDNFGGYNKGGGMAGVWVSRDINDKTSLQFEIEWVQKGVKKIDRETGFLILLMKFNYIDFPIFVNYKINDLVNFKNLNIEKDLKFQAGIIPTYLINSYLQNYEGTFNDDPSKSFHQFTLAGFLGLSYQLSDAVGVDIRFARDISPMGPHPGGQTWMFDYGMTNRWINLGLTYEF